MMTLGRLHEGSERPLPTGRRPARARLQLDAAALRAQKPDAADPAARVRLQLDAAALRAQEPAAADPSARARLENDAIRFVDISISRMDKIKHVVNCTLLSLQFIFLNAFFYE